MGRLSKVAIVICGVVAVLCCAPSSAQAAPLICLGGVGSTSCPPSAPTLAGATQGSDFTLQLLIDGAVDVGDFFIDGLTWSATALQLVNVAYGGALGSCAAAPCFQYDDTVPGALSYISFFDFGAAHSFTGSGALATLTFRPLVSGLIPLAFTGFILLDDSNGNPLFLDATGNPTITGQGATLSVAPVAVPEPATVIMAAAGLIGMLTSRRVQARRAKGRSVRGGK